MISEFKDKFEKRHDICRALHNGGTKIMACFYGLAPKELIHAAGILPVQLIEDRNPKFDEGSKLLPYLCGMSKNLTGQIYCGVYDYVEGVMVGTVCDTNRHVFDIWQYNKAFPYMHVLRAPSTDSQAAVEYYAKALKKLAADLENMSGQKITDDGLKASLAAFNENRELLRKFYEQRPGRVSAEDALYVFAAGLTLPVAEHNDMLKALSASLPAEGQDNGRTGLMLSAINLNMALDVIRMAEKYGAAVVTDDFIHNSRYGLNMIDLDGDPYLALAKGYLYTIPVPGVYSFDRRAEYMRDAMQKAGAEGLIYLNQLNCDAFAMEYAILKERFDKWGLNFLKLEAEDTPSSIEHLNVRMQSFVESLI